MEKKPMPVRRNEVERSKLNKGAVLPFELRLDDFAMAIATELDLSSCRLIDTLVQFCELGDRVNRNSIVVDVFLNSRTFVSNSFGGRKR